MVDATEFVVFPVYRSNHRAKWSFPIRFIALGCTL